MERCRKTAYSVWDRRDQRQSRPSSADYLIPGTETYLLELRFSQVCAPGCSVQC